MGNLTSDDFKCDYTCFTQDGEPDGGPLPDGVRHAGDAGGGAHAGPRRSHVHQIRS